MKKMRIEVILGGSYLCSSSTQNHENKKKKQCFRIKKRVADIVHGCAAIESGGKSGIYNKM